MQRDDLDRRGGAADGVLEIRDRAPNLGRAREKTENDRRTRPRQLDDGIGNRLAWSVADVHRVQRSGHVHDRASAEKCRDGGRFERGGHHHDPQVVARAPGLPRQRDREIGVHAALVKLVEDDRAEAGEERIGLQARGQHAFGDDEQLRVRGEAALEANLPADLAAEGPAAFAGDPRRDGARGDTPRLQEDDRAVRHQRRRHARRLSGAGRGGDDHGAAPADVIDDPIDVGIDWERQHAGVDVGGPNRQRAAHTLPLLAPEAPAAARHVRSRCDTL